MMFEQLEFPGNQTLRWKISIQDIYWQNVLWSTLVEGKLKSMLATEGSWASIWAQWWVQSIHGGLWSLDSLSELSQVERRGLHLILLYWSVIESGIHVERGLTLDKASFFQTRQCLKRAYLIDGHLTAPFPVAAEISPSFLKTDDMTDATECPRQLHLMKVECGEIRGKGESTVQYLGY